MAERKRKTCLSIRDKHVILQKIKNGVSRDAILNKYKISQRSLRRIVQFADEFTNKSQDFEIKNKKRMRYPDHVEVEAVLLKWFIQKRELNEPISTTMIQEKARIFNKMLKGPAKFKASEGWFYGFKKRHGLGHLKGEILANPGKEFSKLLIEKVIRENLKLDNIYNADESGIYWKLLLKYTFVLTENSVARIKDSEDRFTALFCANASGSHKIPLLIIGKSAKPRDLKNFISGKATLHNVKYLPKVDVSYSAQKNGWMNCEIFKKWYEHEFIPRVLEHQRKTGISGKVLLILDNAPSHPSKEELNAIDKNFEVMFLPPNVATLIQPMNQSPISITKKLYKRSLMRKLLLEKDYEKIETFLKELKLRDCLVMLSKEWSSVKQSTLNNAWKALLLENMGIQKYENLMHDEDSSSCETNASVEKSNLMYEFSEHLIKCLSKEDEENEKMSKKVKLKIEEWFNADEGDSGYEILSDMQIVQSVLNRQNNFNDHESPTMVVDQKENIHEELNNDIDEDENIHEELNNDIDEDENIYEEVKIEIDEHNNIHEDVKIEIDEQKNIYEDPQIEIGEVENIHEKPKTEIGEVENIAVNEAHECFLKFKSWMMSHVQCSESQILHFKECEHILRNAIDNS